MRVFKGCLAADKLDFVERKIFQNALPFHVHDFALVVHEVVDGEIFLERIVNAIEAALLESGKVEGGFAQGLAGNGAGVDATAAHVFGALDDGDALAEIRGLGAALLTSRPAADHDEVERLARSHEFLRGMLSSGAVPVSRRIVGEEDMGMRKFLVGMCWIEK